MAAATSKGVSVFDRSEQGQPPGTMAGEVDLDIPTTATAMPVVGQVKQSGFQSSPMVPFVPGLANDREQTTQVGCIYLLSSYIVFHMHLSLNMRYVPFTDLWPYAIESTKFQ